MNINEATQVIEQADECGHVVLLQGLHGIGKTESAAAHARNNGMHYEPLILSLMDTGDMLGLPKTLDVGGIESTVWAAPSWYTNIVNAAWPASLPIDRLEFKDEVFCKLVMDSIGSFATIDRGTLNTLYCQHFGLPNDTLQLLRQEDVIYLDARRSMLLLDEFNRAGTDILNASLQLVLEHRLHTHILPIVDGKETLIVATINPADGEYTVQDFDPALLDRFVICEVEPDFPVWNKYAKSKNVESVIIDYLVDNQGKFHFTPKDGTKGASPRSWTRLDKPVKRRIAGQMSQEAFIQYIKGTIGPALSYQFLQYFNNYSNRVSTKDIEKLVKDEAKKQIAAGNKVDPKEIAIVLEQLVEKLDTVQRAEFSDVLAKKYLTKDSAVDALPMLAYFYALPLESLSATLSSIKTDDVQKYAKLAKLDKEINNKDLFRRVTNHKK